jgi:hypothetical protein
MFFCTTIPIAVSACRNLQAARAVATPKANARKRPEQRHHAGVALLLPVLEVGYIHLYAGRLTRQR